MQRRKQPSIFIGSSSEGLAVARTLEELLYTDANIELWTADVFKAGDYPVDALFTELDRCDYAAFILTPDDGGMHRHDRSPVPRDNVVFEAGFFLGRLGRHRTFLIYDRESDLRLPSDLRGLTLLMYSHDRFRDNPKAALGPCANHIRLAMKDRTRLQELDFIKAYLRFIHPDTSLTDSYCRILTRKLDEIRQEIARLEAGRDWRTLVEVKIRLREYFEYSGSYRYGAECGAAFVRALRELGEDDEAAWTTVKQVAYLYILAGDHRKGRLELQGVLSELHNRSTLDASGPMLRFYCNRYLGISFQREELPSNLDHAKACFDEAQKCIDALDETFPIKKELQARLWCNYGNLSLDMRQPESALKYYCQSMQLFTDLQDPEHIGITNLKIAEATIAVGADLDSARRHLDSAESLFIELGHVELQGRVNEQRAILYLTSARTPATAEAKRNYLWMSKECADRARRLFKQTDSEKRVGAIESFLESLTREFPELPRMTALRQATQPSL